MINDSYDIDSEPIVSLEAFNGPKKHLVDKCIAVEMEVAGVQAVCDFFGLELYDFLGAGDVLAEGNYMVEGLSDGNHNLDKLSIAFSIVERI